MIGIASGVRVLPAMRPVDFCTGRQGLAAEVLGEDPFAGAVPVT